VSRIALIAASCALLLSGCASSATQDGASRQDIFVPHGEFDSITVTSPAAKEVHCPTCDKNFTVRLVRGEAASPQDIVVPSGESFGPAHDAFDANVPCPMCGKMVDVRVHRHAAPAK